MRQRTWNGWPLISPHALGYAVVFLAGDTWKPVLDQNYYPMRFAWPGDAVAMRKRYSVARAIPYRLLPQFTPQTDCDR